MRRSTYREPKYQAGKPQTWQQALVKIKQSYRNYRGFWSTSVVGYSLSASWGDSTVRNYGKVAFDSNMAPQTIDLRRITITNDAHSNETTRIFEAKLPAEGNEALIEQIKECSVDHAPNWRQRYTYKSSIY